MKPGAVDCLATHKPRIRPLLDSVGWAGAPNIKSALVQIPPVAAMLLGCPPTQAPKLNSPGPIPPRMAAVYRARDSSCQNPFSNNTVKGEDSDPGKPRISPLLGSGGWD